MADAAQYDDSFSRYYVQCQQVGCYDCEGVVERSSEANRKARQHAERTGHDVSVMEVPV